MALIYAKFDADLIDISKVTSRKKVAPVFWPTQYVYLGIYSLLHCALAAAQCIVIGPVCGCVTVLLVCSHYNSKLRASILTKLGL